MGWKAKVVGTVVVVGALVVMTDRDESSNTDVPDDYAELYRAAASTCDNLDAALLAGVGSVETDHGRSSLTGVHSGSNSAGAMGPMQFVQETWDAVRAQHPEVGANVYEPAHAIPAAAHLLCDSGVRDGDLEGALWQYNHDHEYVAEVLRRTDAYRRGGAV